MRGQANVRTSARASCQMTHYVNQLRGFMCGLHQYAGIR